MDLKTNGLPFMLQETRSSFSLFHQNIRGLSDKCEELYCSLITSKINPNIICITEHYTTEQNLSTIWRVTLWQLIIHILAVRMFFYLC
jgi:hypothetical protein